jgi:hypothetical protein
VTQREVLAGLTGFALALMFVKGGMALKSALKDVTPPPAPPIAGSVSITSTAMVEPTPCPTQDLKGKVWQQRTQCFEYEDYMKKHGDYPPAVYDFVNAKDMAAWDDCYRHDRSSILMQGCVEYWELVDPRAPLVKWQVKIKRKEPVVKYVWKTYDVVVKASDDYLARQVANKQLDDENGSADVSINVSTKKVK